MHASSNSNNNENKTGRQPTDNGLDRWCSPFALTLHRHLREFASTSAHLLCPRPRWGSLTNNNSDCRRGSSHSSSKQHHHHSHFQPQIHFTRTTNRRKYEEERNSGIFRSFVALRSIGMNAFDCRLRLKWYYRRSALCVLFTTHTHTHSGIFIMEMFGSAVAGAAGHAQRHKHEKKRKPKTIREEGIRLHKGK